MCSLFLLLNDYHFFLDLTRTLYTRITLIVDIICVLGPQNKCSFLGDIYIYMATYTLRIFQSKSTYKNGSVNKTWYEYSQSFMIRLTQFHTYIYCPTTALCLKYSRYSLKHLSINYCLKMLPRKQRQRREDVVLSLGRLLMILINESTLKFMFQCKHLVSIHT